MPVRVGGGACCADRPISRVRVVDEFVLPQLVFEGRSPADQVIAEDRMVDGVAVRLVGVEVEGVVALEKEMMGAHHVRCVEAYFYPMSVRIDVAVVDIVVPE